MATISFDRKIEIKPEYMDTFLDALEADYPPINYNEEKVEAEYKEGREKLDKWLSHR